jgi:signal transduction histidine kinase
MVVEEGNAEARDLLGELQEDAASALANHRDLARGIYPPLPEDRGPVPALRAQADKSPVPVVVDADDIGRLGQNIEAAVYFCCLEALQNIAKYATASRVRICLTASDHFPELHGVRRRGRVRPEPDPGGVRPAQHGRQSCHRQEW